MSLFSPGSPSSHLFAQLVLGWSQPWSPQILFSLPRAAVRLRQQQDYSVFLQRMMGRRGQGERLLGCNCADCVAFPSSLNPAPLIDISGWEAGSLQRAFDIKGVFTPPLHQSKLKLICAYMLLLK